MSLDNFRSQILSNSDGEERVEVNQRLLIDKILARYSAEFVVYRELMQNSDDAKSSSIQIIFETNGIIRNPSNQFKRVKIQDKITRIIFKNDGFPFRVEDWNRLKKIAEGNPDEQKIGAFGVGFYSLFSVCEEPFVSSGGQGMAFFWRGNQLFAKHGQIGDFNDVWTTFLMDMREPLEFPDIEKFSRFLANSLGFTGNLQDVSVYFNDVMVIQLSKRMQDPKLMNITSDFNTFSPQRLFRLTSVNVRGVKLDVKKLPIPPNMDASQWSSLPIDSLQKEEACIFLRIASGSLDVHVSNEFSAEMERTTKKKPPSKTTIQMIYTGFDEHSSSGDISSIFRDLLPYPNQGRVYIGFPTHQTTGCCSHLAARVIPTVERESIDLVEKTLSVYNSEMLCIAGTLCRILYEDEMAQIKRLYDDNIISEENLKSVYYWAAHNLVHFAFRQSTPNPQVGTILESRFFDCSNNQLSILSTNGVLPISDVRILDSGMAGFIKTVPVVPKIIFERCNPFFRKAKDIMKLIRELNIQDVLYELNSRVLSEGEIIELLRWWISYRSRGNIVNTSTFTQLMRLARIDNNSNPRSLNTIRYFLNPGIITPDVDIPNDVLPFSISKSFRNPDLEKYLGWSALSLVNWARFISNKPDLENNVKFAKKVHQILGKNLSNNNISQNDKEIIRQLFYQKKCIPTKFGMKIPNEAYFENVNLFPDLPTIQFPKPSSVKNVMELLGVRKVVELRLIFRRLVGQGSWDHMQLAKYLSSMSRDLKDDEKKTLKEIPIWPKEDDSPQEKEMNPRRFTARCLYAPLVLNREFGLPILDWKGKWARNSQEGRFMIELGLQEFPTLIKILELAASHSNSKIRNKALKYFMDNFEIKYSENYDPAKIDIAFLPCSDQSIYAKPTECYINPECGVMNFHVIRHDLRLLVERLGVRQNPDRAKLIEKLTQHPPTDEQSAIGMFEYLLSRQTDFIESDWNFLVNLKFIPTRDQSCLIIYNSPHNCFIKVQEEYMKDFFLCINFGDKANRFLMRCGVRVEPSPIDLAELLIRSHNQLFNSGNPERYLSILRIISFHFVNYGQIKNNSLIAEMKNVPILIAIKHNYNGNGPDSCCLALGKDIFMNDNTVFKQVFNPFIAPDNLDHFTKILYKELGCRSLHESVIDDVRPISVGPYRETKKSQELQETIRERANLFYFENRDFKKNVEWLKNLSVKEADFMETTYKLAGFRDQVRVKATTACILQNILYVTHNPDSLDISDHIVRNIYKSYEWKNVFCLNVLLTAELSSLKRKGYPVDHIMQQQNLRFVDKFQQAVANKRPIFVTPETTQNLRSSLRGAIKNCNYNVGSYNGINTQASVTMVNESQTSYCDIVPGHLLFSVGTVRDIKLYDTKGIYPAEILSTNYYEQLNIFINILKDLAEVFELLPKIINIFYDNNSNSIAFNKGGALFFNFKFYLGLHQEECKLKLTNNAMTYWYMTFCHELAHNFVASHNSEHEYYLSSYSEIYMSSFLAKLESIGLTSWVIYD